MAESRSLLEILRESFAWLCKFFSPVILGVLVVRDFVFMELVELDTVRHVVVGLLRVYDFSTPQL
ncbi:hypothetical protein BVRB_2g037420 [Beta vulgaris subsp. vulgaris]|nr:hypothetical protein BVRB_2g037420 [Beta vulgaris subsp. vulgaris]